MSDVKDYRVQVRIKNNRILRRIENAGYDNLKRFAGEEAFRDIGEAEGVSPERIRQIEKKALRRAKLALVRTLGPNCLDIVHEALG